MYTYETAQRWRFELQIYDFASAQLEISEILTAHKFKLLTN